jgi:hypothetical protein
MRPHTEIVWLTAIGSLLLALCGVPQAWRAWRRPRSTRQLAWTFLVAWFLGEALMFAGMAPIASWPVLANYLGNTLLTGFLLYSKGSFRDP